MNVFVSVVAVLLFLYYFFKLWRRKGKSIPGPMEWPLVGHGFSMTKDTIHEIYSKHAEKYGDIFKISVFRQGIVVLNSGELIKKAFGEDPYKKHLNNRAKTFYGEKILFGSQSIAFMEKAYNSVHGDLRKGFTRGMHVYGEGKKDFEDKVQTELQNLVAKVDTYRGTEFDMVNLIKRSLSNIVSIILGGHDLKDDDADLNMFWDFDRANDFFISAKVDALMQTFPFLRFIPGIYKTRFEEIVRSKETIIRRYVHNTKTSHKPGIIRGLVDFLIEEQLRDVRENNEVLFTDERIICMTLETVAAGILTTLSTLSTIFLCLMNHPEYQTKIQEEIDREIGRDRLPAFADKQNLTFTEAVTLEALRYVPALQLLVPHKCDQDIDFEGYDIPKDTLIVANIWYVHHDEKIWGDPWKFRPERWLDEDGEILPNDHFQRKNLLTFSYGRRQCVGESLARSRLFLYITTLLQQWNFEMSPEHHVPCDPRFGQFEFASTCRPKPYFCRAVLRA